MRNERNKKQPKPADGDPLTPPELPGITLSASPLSRGPYGAIYKGWDRIHHYDVIVKVQQTTGDPVAADRFRREAEVMARLRHPNIVAVYQFHDGNPSAMVMEYVPGQTLDALIGTEGRLAPARAAGIIEDIAAALDSIHAENVVHRDIKPSNILLPKNGPARLTDFGVAHIDTEAPLTVRGDMLGTIEYASPEQVKGTSAPDARSDVYALAAVAYFALTGTPPFPAADSSMQSQMSVMHQQVFAEPASLRMHRAELTPAIDTAVRRGLAKDPAARYPSAGQFASALRSAVVAASGAPEQVATAVTTRRNYALVGALAGAVILVGGGVAVWNHEQPTVVPTLPEHSVVASNPILASPKPRLPLPIMPERAPAKLKTQVKPPVIAAQSKSNAAVVASVPAIPHAVPVVRHGTQVRPPVRVARAVPHIQPVHKMLAQARLTQKRAVTARPKFRRTPALVAQAGRPARAIGAKPRAASGQAWLAVYAQQDSSFLSKSTKTSAIPAHMVTVDGKPIPTLASGGWATLSAGKHLIAFVPDSGSGYGANPGLWVELAPGAHVSRQVLLPADGIARVRPAVLTASSDAAPAKPIVKVSDSSAQAVANATPASVGWYNVSGWIVRNASAAKPTLVRTSAYWVKVDGKPILALAMGQWAELPAGKHTVTFQPTNGVGVDAKTWDIDLSPQAHLDQKIPLPNSADAAK